jgi:RNA polymerase sigma factor (sigma-70 family)
MSKGNLSAEVSELVAQASAGDPAAETVLCRRFAPAVRAFARRRLRDRDAVEAFTQDVVLLFIEALRRGQVADRERAGGFVLGICRNLARDRARLRERRAALWAELGEVVESYEPPQTATYEVAHLEDCLSQLSERSRNLVRLTWVEARTDAAIATSLAVSEGNVRIMRHRTLQALRDCMSQRISWEAA